MTWPNSTSSCIKFKQPNKDTFQVWKPTKSNDSVWEAKGGQGLEPQPTKEGHKSYNSTLVGLTQCYTKILSPSCDKTFDIISCPEIPASGVKTKCFLISLSYKFPASLMLHYPGAVPLLAPLFISCPQAVPPPVTLGPQAVITRTALSKEKRGTLGKRVKREASRGF